MATLNYHHLRYFREVATQGHLGHAAARLNVSASALSIQIKQLEDRLGHALFDRIGRGLVLTEAGRIALDHADRIFSAGDDLLSRLAQREVGGTPLRVGALSTLSRNFQLQFLRPLLASGDQDIVLKSGGSKALLTDLETLALDVVLTTEVPQGTSELAFAAQKITEQPVALHARAERLEHDNLPDLLRTEPLILPTESVIRASFENLVAKLGVTPRIIANVDDMAMVRLLTREGAGVAVAPAVVLADEISGGSVATAPFDLQIMEPFYAVTLPRKFPHPALKALLALPG
ncbi:LysR family transcriptional regulator [Sulfitobacter aestuariivivens]|uniref:LysR family transcriptional regulator n=1 Tax=Sulfitobacter aestuariivivens TaxID=2766981 RepID=A0A927HDY3_9RHOB|nr:LysR family transcriptional regulator [Sulfitobacter aestuariivivens]MBD3664192.1 LysR family transcriptional regulator [Sulfitobacter aestuariivivens]